MPVKRAKYSNDPNDRVKNKDGTVKRFPYEIFAGDVVVPRYDYYFGEYSRVDGRTRYVPVRGERVVESQVGTDRVKLEGVDHLVGKDRVKVKRKIY